MKSTHKLFIAVIALLLSISAAQAEKSESGYNLSFKIEGIQPDTVYMVSYQGNKVMYFDTTIINTQGEFTFKNDKKLKVGMYGVFHRKRILIQFIGKETNMKMSTDTINYVNNMRVENSEENALLFGFFQFANASNEKSKALSKKLKAAKKDSDKYNKAKEELQVMRDGFNSYRDDIITNHPELFVATLLKARIDPVIPPVPTLPNGKKDSTFSFRYYKKHYFDNIDLSDRRLYRTDLMHQKVFHYLDKMTQMIPDSIIKSVDVILKGTKLDSVTFRYFAAKLLYRYDTSKIVGMSNVLFHIGDKYYLKNNQAYWMDSTQMAKVKERVEMLRYNQIGRQAIDLRLPDMQGKTRSISEIKSQFTVLFFFDASCGHCKKTAPKLLDLYHKYGKDVLTVYAVEGTNDRKKWDEFVSDLELDWINVSDAKKDSHFRQYYDVTSYPTIYLLSDTKKILLKKVSVESIGEAIERDKK
ncbi:MAG: DUF5106 domain-containing protein [Flavobacteriales bacterium]|nr:DUF5106 domain-containing protein [Flavobacteriales bacterium]